MGYAGLHQLQQMKALPVDILKIDKVFIDMLPEDVSMVPAIIQLARGLSLRIVAEGVETEDQYRWLQAAGVEVLGATCSVALYRRRRSAPAIYLRSAKMQICKYFVDLCESAQRF